MDDILVHVRRAYACVTIGCPPSEVGRFVGCDVTVLCSSLGGPKVGITLHPMNVLAHLAPPSLVVRAPHPPQTMNVAVNRPGDTGSNNLAAEAVVMAAVDRVAQNYAGLTEAFRAQWLLEGLDFQVWLCLVLLLLLLLLLLLWTCFQEASRPSLLFLINLYPFSKCVAWVLLCQPCAPSPPPLFVSLAL